MKKLVFALCASVVLTGMSISGAMAFSSPPQQPQNSVNQFIVHAASGCVVNWANGGCGPRISGSGGGYFPGPVVASPPPPPPTPVDDESDCLGLTTTGCD